MNDRKAVLIVAQALKRISIGQPPPKKERYPEGMKAEREKPQMPS
jgi:hypothetical protein